MFDYLRAVCAVPDIQVANPQFNTEKMVEKIEDAANENADIIVFPELGITGYTSADLFVQTQLLEDVKSSICTLAQLSRSYDCLIAVGAPLKIGFQLFDCAVVLYKGVVCGIVPKTFVSGSEKRWFSSADELRVNEIMFSSLSGNDDDDYSIPVGSDIIFEYKENVRIGIELSCDLLSPIPASTLLALNGAEIIINLSAMPEIAGNREKIRGMVKHQSETCRAAYVYASAGECESTQDFIFSGHSVIAETGEIISENDSVTDTDYLIMADIDLEKIRAERLRDSVFASSAAAYAEMTHAEYVPVATENNELGGDGSFAFIGKSPFIPDDENECMEHCMSIFEMQTAALKKRITVTGGKTVIGVSGGLDSTLALLVCVNAMKKLGRSEKDVIAVTLPCFGTTDRTYNNALKLMEKLGVTFKEVNIKEACALHCRDIGHDLSKIDVTFENVQARERTQILMDIASDEGGFVVGTGDLSELALGWCTYNADHMSMYGVNAGVPKTLISKMLCCIAKTADYENCAEVLLDIVDTPISPELLPPDENGNIAQETESLVGPYILHDFFIYYALKYGFSPKKIYAMAVKAFDGEFDSETILKWLRKFYWRFFSQQFKRSCMPDGVKVLSVGLSPRGDLNMPSDAVCQAWIRELEEI